MNTLQTSLPQSFECYAQMKRQYPDCNPESSFRKFSLFWQLSLAFGMDSFPTYHADSKRDQKFKIAGF